MKKLSLLLLALILLAGCGQSKVDYPQQMPEDFDIRFSWAIGAENIYDTYNGRLQKDLVLDGVATAEFEPDREVLAEIYAKVTELDIASIDREMTTRTLSKNGEGIAVLPLTVYEIQFTINGTIYSVTGDATASCYPKNRQAARFAEFVEFMQGVVINTPEFQQMPKPNGGYD